VEIELRQIFERGFELERDEDQVMRLIEIACSDHIIFRGRVQSRDPFPVLSATAMTAFTLSGHSFDPQPLQDAFAASRLALLH